MGRLRSKSLNVGRAIFLVVLVCVLSRSVIGAPWDGNGVDGDPYQIWTAEEMQAIGAGANYLDSHFKLMADIDLSGYTGASFNIIGYYEGWGDPDNEPFTGVFDGNGHTISNFTYQTTDTNGIGLFRYVDDPKAKISDLTLADPNVEAGTGDVVGCLVGYLQYGTITGCGIESGTVSGEFYVGGLVGSNWQGTIRNCYATSSVTGTVATGGLAGEVFLFGTISDCYATGDVDGNAAIGGLVGGVFWGNTISNCYATGTVSGNTDTGGLVGWAFGGTIEESYAVGSVVGNEPNIGGLVGCSSGKTVSYRSCFWNNDINPDVNGIGNTADPNVIGESTANMQTESTFVDAGWDFATPIWQMCALPDYPKLWWQVCPIEIEVEMEVTPAMLNCGSGGNRVEAHFVLPEGYLPEDVDVNTPAVAEPVGVESEYIEVLDEGDGYYRIVAVFDREGFCEALGGDAEKELEVTVKGAFTDGAEFYGTDTIRLVSDHWQHRHRNHK